MLSFQRTSFQLSVIAILWTLIAFALAQDDTGTTQEPSTTTEEDKKIKFWQLLALIILSIVLGFLILAVIACACYVCMKMKDQKKRMSGNHDIVYEGHYSSKKINNGERSRVVAVKTDVYRNRREPFWGVQHAVAQSLDQQEAYGGYDNRAFRSGPVNNGGQQPGYSPVGKAGFYR